MTLLASHCNSDAITDILNTVSDKVYDYNKDRVDVCNVKYNYEKE